MSILVIDQGPELFWFVSQALIEEETQLKHIQSLDVGEQTILQDLPKIVILNGDDKAFLTDKFITKMRNHVFARNTMFIVFTADISEDFKKSLLLAGAAQILYKGRGFSPSPKFFNSIIKWCLTYSEPNPSLFDYKPSPFTADAEFTTYGRVGWLSPTHCLVETNLDLKVGQTIGVKNSVFDELGMKDVTLECLEKNKVGRYYQYTNSLLCKINSHHAEKDARNVESWINANFQISKHKPIKVVYFEDDPNYREVIRQMIKVDKRYCARGYQAMKELPEVLDYQMPQLVLVNRNMIGAEKAKFEKLKDYMKNHFCYCVTYSTTESSELEEFKKNFTFAMHSPSTVDLPLLESMILKLESRLQTTPEEEERIYFNKHSVHSRISFHAHAKLTELAVSGAAMTLPYEISNFCAFDLSSSAFSLAQINHRQYFRVFSSKGDEHQMIFVGQNIHDNKLIKETVSKLDEVGFEAWLKGDETI